MTEYRFTFEMNHRREKSEAPGVGMPDTLAQRSGTLTLPAGNNTTIPLQIAEYTFERLQSAVLFLRGGANNNTRLETWRDSTYWGITTTAQAIVSNTFQTVDLQIAGPVRKDVLQVLGAAATALGDLAGPQTIEWQAHVTRNLVVRNSSSVLFDVFADDAMDPLPNLLTLAERTYKSIIGQGGGSLILATNGNTTIKVNSCAAAFGYGPPIVAAADIGLGFGQIPVTLADWTAARFRPHPRMFVRPSSHLWTLEQLSPFPIGATALTSDVALTPLLASRRPTHSLWTILLEGCLMDVIVEHPIGSDLRRPRDIWNAVWVPAIAGKDLTFWGSYFIGIAPNFTRQFYSRGLGRSLNFLDFAYCADLYDNGGTPLVQFPEI